jgi:simple sugar transport system permease protein
LRRLARWRRPLALLLVLAGLLALWQAMVPRSGGPGGVLRLWVEDGRLRGPLVEVLVHAAPTQLVALGMALVIGLGGIDLSVGSVMALAGIVIAVLAERAAVPVPCAVAAGCALGALLGCWNGLLVRAARVQPLVATLVTMVVARGVAQLVAGGQIVEVRAAGLHALANGAALVLPNSVALVLLAAALLGAGLGSTRIGLAMLVLGDNPRAARLIGVPVVGLSLAAYAACGTLAAAAGAVVVSWLGAADADKLGLLVELDAILAVVVGGTPLRGGRVRVFGTLLGVWIVEVLANVMAAGNVRFELALCAKALLVLVVAALGPGERR